MARRRRGSRSGRRGGGGEERAAQQLDDVGYLAWIVAAAVGAVAACDSAVDSCAVVSLEAANVPGGLLITSPLEAYGRADLLRASLALASLSLTLLTL